MSEGPALPGYAQFEFGSDGIAHRVYHAGSVDGMPVLLMQEIAGFAPGLLAFADRLVGAGFQVFLPWMFGAFGRRTPVTNVVRLCLSREFGHLRAGTSAPITRWLRALVTDISARNADGHVAAIGMCLTGAFAIPLLLHPKVTRAVAAQPSVPISMPHLLAGRDPGARGGRPERLAAGHRRRARAPGGPRSAPAGRALSGGPLVPAGEDGSAARGVRSGRDHPRIRRRPDAQRRR